jgi:MFS family permease
LPPIVWGALDPTLKGLILASGGLQLTAAPEVFLVLWASGRGLEVAWVPLLWAAASAVKTPFALAGGELSDRIGRLPVLALGWGGRIALLLALALAKDGALLTWGLFLGYAACLALTEGAERALVGTCAPPALKATAFGLYHMTVGLAALPGGVLFGSLWQLGGSAWAFAFSAAGTATSAAVFMRYARRAYNLRT